MNTILFKTDNLILAASLVIKYNLHSIEMISSTKAVFCFPQSKELDEQISKFWSNELLVSPLAFQEKVKDLKKQIQTKT